MSRRNRNSNHKPRRKFKKWITLIAAFLLGALALGCINNITAEKELNPNNLIKYENYTNKLEESEYGLNVKWNDNGTFVLSGKHADNSIANDSLYEVPFATVELEPGTYTFSSGNGNASEDSYGLWIKVGTDIYRVWSDSRVFEVTEATSAVVGFAVKNNYRIVYAKFAPVLVSGSTAQDFFVED